MAKSYRVARNQTEAVTFTSMNSPSLHEEGPSTDTTEVDTYKIIGRYHNWNYQYCIWNALHDYDTQQHTSLALQPSSLLAPESFHAWFIHDPWRYSTLLATEDVALARRRHSDNFLLSQIMIINLFILYYASFEIILCQDNFMQSWFQSMYGCLF